jgi:hypothetical protein
MSEIKCKFKVVKADKQDLLDVIVQETELNRMVISGNLSAPGEKVHKARQMRPLRQLLSGLGGGVVPVPKV